MTRGLGMKWFWLLALLPLAAPPARAQTASPPDHRIEGYQDLYKEATDRLVEWRAQALVSKDQAQQFAKETESLLKAQKADTAEIAKLKAALRASRETKPAQVRGDCAPPKVGAPSAPAAPAKRSDPE